MTEQWFPVVGYEGLYEVSDQGQIRTVINPWNKNPERRIKATRPAHKDTRRYQIVGLSKAGLTKVHTVHSVVALAFLGPRPGNHVIDHIDGNRNNNAASNLRYCSNATNTRRGSRAKLTPRQVLEIRAMYERGKYSQAFIGRHFGVTQRTVSHIVNAVSWQADLFPDIAAEVETA